MNNLLCQILCIWYVLALALATEPQEVPEFSAAETEFMSDEYESSLKFREVRYDQYHWADLIKAENQEESSLAKAEKEMAAAKTLMRKVGGTKAVKEMNAKQASAAQLLKKQEAARKAAKKKMSWQSVMDIAKQKDRARVRKQLRAIRKEKKDWAEKQRLWDKKSDAQKEAIVHRRAAKVATSNGSTITAWILSDTKKASPKHASNDHKAHAKKKPQEESLVAEIKMDDMDMDHTMKFMEKKVTNWASPGYYKDPKKRRGWVPGRNLGMMDSHGMLAPIECNLRGASLALANEPDQRKFKQIRAAMKGFTQAAIDTPIKHVGMDGYYGCVICTKTCNFMLYECVNQPWGHPAKHGDIMTFLHKQGGMAKYNKLQQLVAKDKTFATLAKQREEVVCSMHM